MAHDVFISYSQKDKPTADAACAALEAAGIRSWIAPRDVPAGMSWPAAIVGAIGKSRVMVLVFSSHAIASEEVQREVVQAFQHRAVVVPLRIEEILPSGDMAYYMSATHWLDALTPPLEAHLQRLCETVGSIVGSRPGESLRESHILPPEMPRPTREPQPGGRSRRSIVIGGGAAAVGVVGVLLAIMMFPKESQRELGTPSKAAVNGSERGSSKQLSSIASTVQAPSEVDGGKQNKSDCGSPTAPTAAPQPPGDPFVGTYAGQRRDDNSLKTKLVWIPPDNFTMGSPYNERDRRYDENQVQVTLSKGFWLGQHEVTEAEWQHVIHTAPWTGQNHAQEGHDYPATYVSWDDATAFCEKLAEQEHSAGRLPSNWHYTLPSEAQWEYACRAGTKSCFSFGDNDSDLEYYAWFAQNANYAHLVGQKKVNPWGLTDMHGNVSEWCHDSYSFVLRGGTDPEGSSEGSVRVVRGGSWGSAAGQCRSANRSANEPGFRSSELGFRVALVPSGK
jgi:formylglycine-generating enzyme required for sulfatase activity